MSKRTYYKHPTLGWGWHDKPFHARLVGYYHNDEGSIVATYKTTAPAPTPPREITDQAAEVAELREMLARIIKERDDATARLRHSLDRASAFANKRNAAVRERDEARALSDSLALKVGKQHAQLRSNSEILRQAERAIRERDELRARVADALNGGAK